MELNVIDLSREAGRRTAAQESPRRPRQVRDCEEEPGRRPGRRRFEEELPVRRSGKGRYEEELPVRRQRPRGYEEGPARRPGPRGYEEGPVRRPKPGAYERQAPVKRSRAADERARQERLRRKKRRRRKQLAARLTVVLFLAGLVALLVFVLARLVTGRDGKEKAVQTFRNSVKEQALPKENEKTLKPFITEDFLTVNEYSRPGEALESVNNIFVHYTANRGTSAAQNRSYFENLGITGETSASAHFIIGYDGEIIQCIPLDEIGYAVVGRNYDSISIECCYLQEDGKFTDKTYQSLIRLCAWLLDEYQLTPEDMKRHYDEGGKKCPLYFTEHVEAWEQFKRDLEQYITEQGSL